MLHLAGANGEAASQQSKEEADARSIYVGNVSLQQIDAVSDQVDLVLFDPSFYKTPAFGRPWAKIEEPGLSYSPGHVSSHSYAAAMIVSLVVLLF